MPTYRQVFSAFLAAQKIILGQELVPDRKTNEVPALRHLISELGITGCPLTVDALHCQKTLATAKETGNEARSSK